MDMIRIKRAGLNQLLHLNNLTRAAVAMSGLKLRAVLAINELPSVSPRQALMSAIGHETGLNT